jgi:hypothetical protein
LQALPQEKVFAAEYPPGTDDDTTRQLTTALMVNLTLYREIDFHLDPKDWDNFRDIAYDAEHGSVKKASRDGLLGWIGHYLEVAGVPHEVKKYAVEYWRNCLRLLEAEMRGMNVQTSEVSKTSEVY